MRRGCPRCEQLPDSPPESGVLYLAPPIEESREALASYLSQSGMPYSQITQGLFAIHYSENDLERFCADYLCNVSQLEMQDTKTIILEEGYEPTTTDFIKMQQLSSLVARIEGTWLIDVLREERITAFFQPIIEVENSDTVYGYECLSRGISPSGEYIPPSKLFGIARSADLLFNLDRTCRLSVIRDAVAQNIQNTIFINFNPTAIYNPDYCLQTTLAAIKKAKIPAEQIVFEVVESEDIKDTDHLVNILDFYRNRGFKVALDDMGAGYSSLNLLSKLKPEFMKLDMELIRDVDKDDYKATITKNLIQLAKDLGVLSIAEGVETMSEWEWVKSHGADFVQGYLFAEPAPTPPAPKKL